MLIFAALSVEFADRTAKALATERGLLPSPARSRDRSAALRTTPSPKAGGFMRRLSAVLLPLILLCGSTGLRADEIA
jgi:hypothetical protein